PWGRTPAIPIGPPLRCLDPATAVSCRRYHHVQRLPRSRYAPITRPRAPTIWSIPLFRLMPPTSTIAFSMHYGHPRWIALVSLTFRSRPLLATIPTTIQHRQQWHHLRSIVTTWLRSPPFWWNTHRWLRRLPSVSIRLPVRSRFPVTPPQPTT